MVHTHIGTLGAGVPGSKSGSIEQFPTKPAACSQSFGRQRGLNSATQSCETRRRHAYFVSIALFSAGSECSGLANLRPLQAVGCRGPRGDVDHVRTELPLG